MNLLKQFIKKYIPFIFLLKDLSGTYYYDVIRYYKYSSYKGYNTEKKLKGKIIERYHSIEKGLTMPEFRLGFGINQLNNLINDCLKYIYQYGIDDDQLKHALSVVLEYEFVHNNNNFKINPDSEALIQKIKDLDTNLTNSKQVEITKKEYFKEKDSNFLLFSNSRRSVRNFIQDKNIPVKDIIEAIELSFNYPSACNRQSARVYLITDPVRIKKVLEIQGGNRGFGHLTNKLIVITSEIGVYNFINERNLCFVDGGIYAMNLLYALHYKEISACILNCATKRKKDLDIRGLCDIENSENIIAMVACGYSPDKFKVGISKRHSSKLTIKQINN